MSKYLPNEAVSNDEMEGVLGMVNGKPSRARALVLRNNGIKRRYYALKDHKATHSNTEIAVEAVKGLFDEQLPLSMLEVLTAGTSSPDQMVPSHASMIHGLLKDHPIEIMTGSGTCCSSIQGLKYAYMSVASGLSEVAASVGSERFSAYTHASRYQQEADNWSEIDKNGFIAFEKDFLRWMLSDGAAAVLLQPTPNKEGLSLRIEWIEILSYANDLDTCMYSGATKDAENNFIPFTDIKATEWGNDSIFSFKQDTRLLGDNIVPRGGMFIEQLMKKHNISGEDIDYYMPHMSSEFFKKQIYDYHEKIGMHLPYEKWFYNLPTVGNVGSASAFLMPEEAYNNGMLSKGQRILVMVPESARFTYAYFYLTVV